jgi:hypothetical protein
MTPEGSAAPGYGTAPPPPGPPHRAVALACGLGTGLGGALAWGVTAYYVHHNLTLLAVLIGPLVGCTVARLRPRDLLTAAGSALLALAACVLGRFLMELFALAGVGVTVSSILGHLGLIAIAYRYSIGASVAVSWAVAAGLAFLIPLRWAARPRTPTWRRP